VFIESTTPTVNGAEIKIVFSLPNYGKPFKVAGHIAWTSLQGLGVQFDTTSAYLEAMIRLL
jgi:hypothetical protein